MATVIGRIIAIIGDLTAIMTALTEEMADRGTTISESLVPPIKASLSTLRSRIRKSIATRKNAVRDRKEINAPRKTIFTKMMK